MMAADAPTAGTAGSDDTNAGHLGGVFLRRTDLTDTPRIAALVQHDTELLFGESLRLVNIVYVTVAR